MSFERDMNLAVRTIVSHIKAVVSKNMIMAVRTGKLTLDETKLPGLDLLISNSVDDAFMQSSSELTRVLQRNKDARD